MSDSAFGICSWTILRAGPYSGAPKAAVEDWTLSPKYFLIVEWGSGVSKIVWLANDELLLPPFRLATKLFYSTRDEP